MTISTQRLILLRGNTAASSAFTGYQGELIVDTTLKTIRVQDGSTPGGTLLATAAQLANVSANSSYGNANVGAYLTSYTGNLTAGNILSNNYLYANGVNILTGIQSNYGNANVAAYLASNSAVPITTTSNVTAAYYIGNGSLLTGIVANTTYNNTNVASYLTGNIIVGNISGNEPNVTLVANTYSYVFSNIGNVSFPGNLTVSSNVSASYFTGNGSQLSGVATKATGTWTLSTGANTVDFTVPANGVYSIWVNGNIPNGIVAYTATVIVTNTNVPVIGSQYGWYYETGNALVLTSIPAQIIGTEGAISNAAPSVGTTTNTFAFGITNNSGNSAVVNWGYTKLS